MATNRRDFLKTAGLLSVGLGLNATPGVAATTAPGSLAAPSRPVEKSPNPKRILIFGGTGFIGPNTVKYAVERGHWVSIFTRGRTEADIPASVEQLIGDRNDNHDAIMGREWDVVIDNNTSRDYRWVQRSTEILKESAGHYIFVSSISAYEAANQTPSDGPLMEPVVDANYPLEPKPAGWTEGEPLAYGAMKAYAEQICHEAFPGRCTVVRPGLIVGPGDPTNRFTYWPSRIAEGGDILCPGDPMHANQIIDQRDLTEWIVRLGEDGTMGNFNGVGPGWRMSMAEMIYGIAAAFNTERTFTWVTEEFLAEQGVSQWSDLPSWMPGAPLMFVDNAPAVAAGLTFRPLATIAHDTHEWNMTRPADQRIARTIAEREGRPFGISREREQQVLAAWHARGM